MEAGIDEVKRVDNRDESNVERNNAERHSCVARGGRWHVNELSS